MAFIFDENLAEVVLSIKTQTLIASVKFQTFRELVYL